MNSETQSKYAKKVQGKRMMYGNGKTCCGHRHVPDILARMGKEDREIKSSTRGES